jgi:hypothetical protein
MKRKIAVIIQGEQLGEWSAPLFWQDSAKAKALLAKAEKKGDIWGTVYLTYFDGEEASFRVESVDVGHENIHGGLSDLQAGIRDGLLAWDSLDKLFVFSTDSGFPMFVIDNLE